MKFCLITTFFGPHSFGGDGTAVLRLAIALLKRGHTVHVIYPVDAYTLLSDTPPRDFVWPDGLVVHALHSKFGNLSQLYIHQTGTAGDLKSSIKAILDAENFDVIHAHNISLIGGPSLLHLMADYPQAVQLMTTHEHWLLCPLSNLWRFNREVCEKPTCITCTLVSKRPPQLWRFSNRIPQAVRQLDALISPSQFTLHKHQDHGLWAKHMVHIPLFLPDGWAPAPLISPDNRPHPRPYFLAVGRLVKEKGYQTLLPAMAQFPEVDLLIAGDGNYKEVLLAEAAHLPNVHFLDYLDKDALLTLYRGAVALLVPSLVLETFGFVILEALAVGTPVIARKRGAFQELIMASQGGLTFETNDELVDAMRQLLDKPAMRTELGQRGQKAVATLWTEEAHLQKYFALIATIQSEKKQAS